MVITMSQTDRQLVTLVLVLFGAVLLLPVLVGGAMGFGPALTGMWDGGMWGTRQSSWWMTVAGVVLRLVALAVVIAVGYLFYHALTDEDDSDQALEDLRLAYARGDLSDEEYESRREILQRDI